MVKKKVTPGAKVLLTSARSASLAAGGQSRHGMYGPGTGALGGPFRSASAVRRISVEQYEAEQALQAAAGKLRVEISRGEGRYIAEAPSGLRAFGGTAEEATDALYTLVLARGRSLIGAPSLPQKRPKPAEATAPRKLLAEKFVLCPGLRRLRLSARPAPGDLQAGAPASWSLAAEWAASRHRAEAAKARALAAWETAKANKRSVA